MSSGEFAIIEQYFSRSSDDPDVLRGVGDDAAVVAANGALAVAVDTLVEGVHFPAGLAAEAVGYRVLAVNLSDMAAMGAQPRWCTLALTLAESETTWLEGFADGLYGLAERFGVALIGGDLTRGPLTVSLQILGTVEPTR
nr:thiamine-phosphate kinase [Gammaproteobacteria bacterium]